MQRRLIVMRHANSPMQGAAHDSDHSRSLDHKGRADAPRVALRIAELGWVPQHIVSSDAARTRETCDLMLPHLGVVATHFTSQLYLADLDDIRAQLVQLPREVSTVLVLGHNPGWEMAVWLLSGQFTRMAAACAALLEGGGESWEHALDATGAWQQTAMIEP